MTPERLADYKQSVTECGLCDGTGTMKRHGPGEEGSGSDMFGLPCINSCDVKQELLSHVDSLEARLAAVRGTFKAQVLGEFLNGCGYLRGVATRTSPLVEAEQFEKFLDRALGDPPQSGAVSAQGDAEK